MDFRLNASMTNFVLDQADEITGLAIGGARIQLPPAPRGPVIFNNLKVDNSVVGAINTGNVKTIDVSLTHLHNAGNDKASDVLKALIEAILSDPSLDSTLRNELVEQLAFLSEQTVCCRKGPKARSD